MIARNRTNLTLAYLAAIVIAAPAAVSAYLTLGTTVDGSSIPIRWSSPINYFVTSRGVTNVTPVQLQSVLAQSFSTWTTVVPSVSATFSGFTNAEPVREDGATVIGFQEHPELDRTLGLTAFTVDRTSGQLVEADVFLNSLFDWSTAPAGEPNKFDVQSTLTHEIGHVLGLAHSLLGETELRAAGGRRVLAKRAVMFPIAFAAGTTLDRALQDDDKAAIAVTYPPSAQFLRDTGSVSGHVTLDGAGIFGAHVVAFNTKTGEMVGAFSLNASGQFSIDGLTPGIYVLRVEPIDDADISSFFGLESKVEAGFQAAVHPKLITVPRGGFGETVEIKVVRK
jgi:hypothetical protein